MIEVGDALTCRRANSLVSSPRVASHPWERSRADPHPALHWPARRSLRHPGRSARSAFDLNLSPGPPYELKDGRGRSGRVRDGATCRSSRSERARQGGSPIAQAISSAAGIGIKAIPSAIRNDNRSERSQSSTRCPKPCPSPLMPSSSNPPDLARHPSKIGHDRPAWPEGPDRADRPPADSAGISGRPATARLCWGADRPQAEGGRR